MRTEKENLFFYRVFKMKIYITYLIVIFKWENIFEIHVYDKGLISKSTKNYISIRKGRQHNFAKWCFTKGISNVKLRQSSDTKKCKLNP